MVQRRARRTPVPPSAPCCSFCGKSDDAVQRLIAGPAVFICNECVGLCNEILSEESTAGFGALDEQGDDELLAAMARLDGSRGQVEQAVDRHARVLRGRGVSWAAIGSALGISRQAAWERFTAEG